MRSFIVCLHPHFVHISAPKNFYCCFCAVLISSISLPQKLVLFILCCPHCMQLPQQKCILLFWCCYCFPLFSLFWCCCGWFQSSVLHWVEKSLENYKYISISIPTLQSQTKTLVGSWGVSHLFMTAIYSQKAVLKIKSAKFKCFLRFSIAWIWSKFNYQISTHGSSI